MAWAACGIDIGTTRVKGVVIACDGTRLRRISRPLPPRPSAHRAELDPEVVADVVQGLADDLWPFDALGVVGLINTHLLVGEDGRALTPAILWNDGRASSYAEDGWRASSLVSRARWWRAEMPDAFAAARWAMLPRDYVLLRLTGTVATDPTSWPDLTEDGALTDRVPAELRARLPALNAPESVVGSYRGVPVVAGCMDSVAAVLGVGATPPGTAIDVAGTSEAAGVVAATRIPTDAVRGTLRLPDGYWHAGPTQAGGRALDWVSRLVGATEQQKLRRMIDGNPATPTGVVFLPYLEGERAPLWDPESVGAFVGLRAPHDSATLVRAVLEGVAMSVRHLIEATAPEGTVADRLVVCGGPSKLTTWNQIKADVTNLPTFVPDEAETGVIGAAMLAAAGLEQRPLAEMRARLAPRASALEPDRANARRYEVQYASYRSLWPAIEEGGHRGEAVLDSVAWHGGPCEGAVKCGGRRIAATLADAAEGGLLGCPINHPGPARRGRPSTPARRDRTPSAATAS